MRQAIAIAAITNRTGKINILAGNRDANIRGQRPARGQRHRTAENQIHFAGDGREGRVGRNDDGVGNGYGCAGC